MLKNGLVYLPTVVAISTSLTISSVTAMKEEKDSFFSYSKMFGQAQKKDKGPVQENKSNFDKKGINLSQNNYKTLYDNEPINVSDLSDNEIIKIAYIATNFVVKHNDVFLNKINDNDVMSNTTVAQVFLGRMLQNSKGISWKKFESRYSNRQINLDYFKNYRVKFSMSPNTIHLRPFNTDNAQNYPLLQAIVRNLNGDQDELVEKAASMFHSFLNSKIKSNDSQQYSEEEAKIFFDLEQKIYSNKKN